MKFGENIMPLEAIRNHIS